ncbi:hypothetical protein [Jannaschia ovalis]|uniref:Uncharacterized protein n=1 Tax=Jannaschia ovalis TaxID=3038773 RepID=A0ABY8LCU8_9RHOB|nr:hypothetical protein [Jannaschia sp. GRR-S6-38]WGH79149.1 hypothetical protein P8627_02480 [Jannaschia sp. GRR-S6-38]
MGDGGSGFVSSVGLLAAGLSVLGYLAYIRETLRRRIAPCRASWLIWSVLGTIALSSLVSEGATTSLVFAAAQVGGTIFVFGLAALFGRGAYLRRGDWLVLVAAALGLALWQATANAAYALAITISISLLGGVLTAVKALIRPRSEPVGVWMIFLAASLFGLASVREAEPVLQAYPLYLIALYAMIVSAILIGRRRARVPEVVPASPGGPPLPEIPRGDYPHR